VVYVALLVSDQDKALDFYTNVIGLEKRGDYPTPDGPRFLTVAVKGQDFEIVLWPGTPGRANLGSAVYTSSVHEPEAFLRRAVTRLCLDQLKSARRQRETYIGPWLPEPVLEQEEEEDVTLPLMLALERLSPLERAAFLLHNVFGLGFEEVAATVRRNPAACRQLAARARTHVREARPRYQLERQRGLELAKAFFTASRTGDMKALGAMLAADVSAYADGGGKRTAAMQPVVGFDAVMKVQEYLADHFRNNGSKLVRAGFINGLPGFITLEADGELQTTALEIENGKVATIYVVRNPDKLKHLR
jgi:RNA polymerase sigma-70 factor (ECF subfamily)